MKTAARELRRYLALEGALPTDGMSRAHAAALKRAATDAFNAGAIVGENLTLERLCALHSQPGNPAAIAAAYRLLYKRDIK